MISLALPDRRLLRVDLYPRVTEAKVSIWHKNVGCEWQQRTLARLHNKRQLGVDGVRVLLVLLNGSHLDGVVFGIVKLTVSLMQNEISR